MNQEELKTLYDFTERALERAGLDGWRVAFNNRKTALGTCRFRDNTINFSTHHLKAQSLETMRDVALHEVAHAIAGPGAGHGPEWKEAACNLGARPERIAANAEKLQSKMCLKCPSCKKEINAWRRPRRASSCAACGNGRYDEKLKLVYMIRGGAL